MNKIPLPQSYHNFSDKQTILGIPNGANVLSNFAILIPAILYYRKRNKNNLLFIHLLLLAIASSYYHLNPSDDTLFWDFLMIATTSMIIFTMMSETKNGTLFYLLGILSVIYWKMTGDLRLYLIILIGLPLYIVLKYYKDITLRKYVITFIITFTLARLFEHNDHFMYQITNQQISGHTLKHIIGSIGILSVVKILEETNKF